MNNYHQYQRNVNASAAKDSGVGVGGYGNFGMGLGNPGGAHPQNGGRNPSPQPAWGVNGPGLQQRGAFGGAGTLGNSNQSRLTAPGRSRMNSNDMLMVLKKGMKDREAALSQDADPHNGIFDPSEFPSLGGDTGSSIGNTNGFGGYSDLYTSGSAYGGSFRTKPQELGRNVDLRAQADEFPALSSTSTAKPRGEMPRQTSRYEPGFSAESPDHRLKVPNNSALSSGLGSMSSYGDVVNKPLQPTPTARPRAPQVEGGSASGTIGEPRSDDIDAYGMKGLLKVIAPNTNNSNNSDAVFLALGIDLTTLGLNLNAAGLLYESFRSPFGERGSSKGGDPKFKIPSCYFTQPPLLKTAHFSKFQLESLFYIFYSMPRDVLQVYAALELYERDWRYHKELKLWFTRVPGMPMTYDRGSYIYFDIAEWERRPFHDANRSFVQGFLSQEEISSGVT